MWPESKLPVAVIVAHPDDETLWSGGHILMRPDRRFVISTLCRGSDPDRAPRFHRVLERLRAAGTMGDLDDGPDQRPLEDAAVREAILSLLPETAFSAVITHGPRGEYTRHRRHEEVSRAVRDLWRQGLIRAPRLMMFAYEDAGGKRLPEPRRDAHLHMPLPIGIRREKHDILTGLYGFGPDSWEVRAAPREEAFWSFDSVEALDRWMREREQAA